MLDTTPNDLKWIHLDIKMIVAFKEWCNKATIKELEWSYQKGELVEVDEWLHNYKTNKFMMFNRDIIA